MKLDRYALLVALCLGASPAVAQQSMPQTRDGSLPASPLVRSCTALGSSTDCAIGLRNRSLQQEDANRNALSQRNGSGLPSTFQPRETMGSGEDMLSRGISGGTIGNIGAAGSLGQDSDPLLHHSMSGGTLGGRSLGGGSLGGGSLGGGSLGGGSLGGGRMH